MNLKENSASKSRLELLLNLTTKITSSLDLRRFCARLPAEHNAEVIDADAVSYVPDDSVGENLSNCCGFSAWQGGVEGRGETVTLSSC